MTETPKSNRIHLGIYGRRNVGKSSLINALTSQQLSIVSEIAGTTTDPVEKAIEILPLGPVVLIDTAGIDDEGELGKLRIEKTYQTIRKIDLALLVISHENGWGSFEEDLAKKMIEQKTEFIVVYNKDDKTLLSSEIEGKIKNYDFISVSARSGKNIFRLKGMMAKKAPSFFEENTIVGDLIQPGDTVVLVIPIDTGMPKNRLILPQVQTIRDILDHDAEAYVTKERELRWALDNLKRKPKLVITDSHAFMKVDADLPKDIPLTSFSILFSRYKGELYPSVEAVHALKNLKSGAKVLMAEACTHHAQPDDLGRVKIPRWIKTYLGVEIEFIHVQGRDFPENLKDYDLIVQCGGCMLTRREMLYRVYRAKEAGVPIINYGVIIAFLHGILKRSLEVFGLESEVSD